MAARCARAPRRLHRTPDVAHVADHRRGLRRGARRVGVVHLHLRAAGLAAGQMRRGQLHDAGLVRPAGPPARRPGQGRRGVLGGQRPGIGLVGRQRGDRRHLHHPADEKGRLRRRARRRHRNGLVGQRPDHAAGHGRGRLPDDRVRGHSLHRHHSPRDPAGLDLVHRAVLQRAPGSAQAGHRAHDGRRQAAHAAAEAGRLGHGHQRHADRDGPGLLDRRGRAGGGRRGRDLDPAGHAGGAEHMAAARRRAPPRPAHRDRRQPSGAPRAMGCAPACTFSSPSASWCGA
ncbi:Uncharacterised protein [Bordetella pertussis]|nr:Uncharacterised protein [Bordetella pertussis]